MVVYEHHRTEYGWRFLHRSVAVGGRKLVKERKDGGIGEILGQEALGTLVEIGKKPKIGDGMGEHGLHG
ncbi:hypothetical protein SDC9_189677 [bioreactor metagenome]|uniref:Uncharacterized protein n=1 Tax=bioreactor metagenome TaxID=1076179 RepID=A0A645HSV0_9ZZZZ